MKTCENCGSRVYGLGCVNCDEMNYIEEQEMLTDQMIRDQELEDRRSSAETQPGEPNANA